MPTLVAPLPTSTASTPPPTIEPVSQGWVVNLSNLTQENNYHVSLDVLSPLGWPLGNLIVQRGQSYEQQGSPDLISTIRITTSAINTTTVNPLLELAASQAIQQSGYSSSFKVMHAGYTYDETSKEGWRVHTAVKILEVDEHPILPGGLTGPSPVFTSVELDIQVGGAGASPYLGITADNITRSRAATENLRGPDLQLLDHGVVVRTVLPGSPAAKAGLIEGDSILALSGQKIDETNTLSVLVGRHKTGDRVSADVMRDGKAMTVEIVLVQRP